MPNWCAGTLKIRGKKDNIINFFKNGVKAVTYLFGEETARKFEVENDEYCTYLTIESEYHYHICGTYRLFIVDKNLEFDFDNEEDEHIIYCEVEGAWGIDTEGLRKASKEYDVDFKIYAFEKGMEFNQDVEIIKGNIVKDEKIEFDNYSWECICPDLGG